MMDILDSFQTGNEQNSQAFVPSLDEVKLPVKHTYQKNRLQRPRRNKSAFIIFSIERRSRLKQESDLNSNEMMVRLGEEWKTLNPEVRQKYQERATEDKIRYHREIEIYSKTRPTEPLHNRTKNNHVKKPCSAYGLFVRERKPMIKLNFPDCKMADVLKIVSQEWKKLPENYKQNYQRMALVEKEIAQTKLCQAYLTEKPQKKDKEKEKENEKNKKTKGKKNSSSRKKIQPSPKADQSKDQAMVEMVAPTETKCEFEYECKVETKAEHKVETRAESRTETKIEHNIEPKAEHRTEYKTEPKAEHKIEAKMESKTEYQTNTKMEAKVEVPLARSCKLEDLDTKVETGQPSFHGEKQSSVPIYSNPSLELMLTFSRLFQSQEGQSFMDQTTRRSSGLFSGQLTEASNSGIMRGDVSIEESNGKALQNQRFNPNGHAQSRAQCINNVLMNIFRSDLNKESFHNAFSQGVKTYPQDSKPSQ